MSLALVRVERGWNRVRCWRLTSRPLPPPALCLCAEIREMTLRAAIRGKVVLTMAPNGVTHVHERALFPSCWCCVPPSCPGCCLGHAPHPRPGSLACMFASMYPSQSCPGWASKPPLRLVLPPRGLGIGWGGVWYVDLVSAPRGDLALSVVSLVCDV